MAFIVIMIIIAIAIIALIVRYLYVQAHILSSKEFRKTAEKQTFKMRAKSTEITCDFCGCVINTAKEKRCPNCGAVYGEDKELKERFQVDEKAVEKKADAAAKEAVEKAHAEGLEVLKHIRIAIIALVGVFVLMIIYAGIFYSSPSSSYAGKFRENEKLQDNDYTEYTLISEPNVTIFDKEGVTMRLVSVYADDDNAILTDGMRHYRLGISLVNTRKEPVTLYYKIVGINGRCKSRQLVYIGSHFKAGAKVLFYENVYGEYFDSIDEIAVGEKTLYILDQGELYKSDVIEKIKVSDEDYPVITDDADTGTVIFENDKIRIRCLEKEKRDRGYDVWIENLSDHDYYVDTSDMMIDGKTPASSYILYDNGLPAGYTLHHDNVYCRGEDFEKRAEDSQVELSFSFSDLVDPSNDFSTGFVTLK